MGSNKAVNGKNITYSPLGYRKTMASGLSINGTFVSIIPKKNLKPNNPVDMKYIKKPRIRVSNFNMIRGHSSIMSS